MGSGIFFPLCALPIIITIIIIFNVKKHIHNSETKIYNYLITINLIGLIIEILCAVACRYYKIYPVISFFVLKTYIVYLIGWTATFAIYVLRVTLTNWKDLYRKIHWSILIVLFFIIYVLPIDVVVSDNYEIFYTTGTGVSFSYFVSGLYILGIFLILLSNINKLKDKKYLPVFVFFVIGTLAIIIQKTYPQFLLLTYTQTLICLIMYFTIENPDLKMLRETETAKMHAEKANRAKSDFLASMSHEIRTPLNAIVGLTEDNMTYKDKLPEVVQENNEDIFNASQTLLEIVGNILDINRIEAEKIDLNPVRYNIREEVDKICKMQASRIGEKKIQFSQNIAEDVPVELIGDKVLVKQVLNNLLSNAIKYTEEGYVKVDINSINRGKDAMIIINVSDTGRGIKKEYIDKLFGKFERLDIEKNTTTQGTGLGLAITKSYVEMMGGKINVQSEFGKGSLFVVTIPQEIGKQDIDLTNTQVLRIYNTNNIKLNETLEQETHTAENIVQQNPIEAVSDKNENQITNVLEKTTLNDTKKVLIVDDNRLNLKVARRAVEGLGFEIDEATNGEEAIEKIKEKEFDIILMDIMMPGMSGDETLIKLKEDPTFNIPVIAVTADVESGSENKYLSQEFTSYIGKPFTKDQIKSEIDKIFK